MNKKRIVITGIGIVSSLGMKKELYWQNLFEGKSGVAPITLFDTSGLNVKIGGEVKDFVAADILGKAGLIDLDRATTLLLSAAKFALEDSGSALGQNSTETGVSVGVAFGSTRSLSEFDRQSIEESPSFVNPSRFPNLVPNSPASRAAIRYAIKGPNATLSTGLCAFIDALDYAANTIQCGRAKKMLVGAVEEMCIQTFLGFYEMGYLSGSKNDHEPLSCPFDVRRDGIIFSEGACVIVLEELSAALERQAPIYAQVLGIGAAYEPFRLHKYSQKAEGISQAMIKALNHAGLVPEDIDCIYANANSTQDADLAETKGIKQAFKSAAGLKPITAVKSMLGETFCASGGLATIAALGSLQNQIIPPTINLQKKGPGCDLDYVTGTARKQKVDRAMVNSFNPNGANSVLILGKNL